MKKILSILLAALMLAGVLASCGEQTQAEVESSGLPASQSEEQATQESPAPESEAESDTEEEQATPEFEYEYVPPEDGSFTICGVPLEEYTFVLYFPGSEEYMRMNRAALLDSIQTSTRNATGLDLEFKVAKNEKMFTEKKYEHEILFGSGFVREGMPERNPKKNYYGVTEDGTVYFTAVCVMSYRELWNRFLAEFFGVPEGSGAASAGCSVPACYREYPEMNEEWLTQNGYSLVFADEFDGDALNMDV
ncbi:MAG: hypothetical protein J5494_04275 [Candidatus Methanomethylophilaceae archaeon]|nr:hypothetical protein [Candidatus Methanomethylophilaceae archaeon]